jgi:hypothetical protein
LALCWNSGTIGLVDLRTRRVRQLRPRTSGGGTAADTLLSQDAVWAPKGDALLVCSYSPGGLWRVELDGRATRLFTSPDFNNPWIGFPQLSPNGRKVAFARLTQQYNVWLIEGLR